MSNDFQNIFKFFKEKSKKVCNIWCMAELSVRNKAKIAAHRAHANNIIMSRDNVRADENMRLSSGILFLMNERIAYAVL